MRLKVKQRVALRLLGVKISDDEAFVTGPNGRITIRVV